MICMAALLIFAASCKKEKNEQINENGGDGLGFNVKTEVHSGDSKTYLFNRQVLWNTDDQIKVYNTNGDNAVFTYVKLVEEGDGTTAEFNSNDVTASFFKPNYRGYYPTNFDPTNYTLGQHQTYTTINIDGVNYPTFAKGANPMMATNEPKKLLHFKNVLGILELQLKSVDNSMAVKEIRVHSNNDEKLWGTGNVNANGEFVVTSGGSNTVILNCGGITINSTTTTSFFILLPPGTLSGGFEVDVVDTDGEFWIKKTTNPNTIVRSRIKKMPEQSVKTGNCEDVQLWEGGPYWATKNLGAENPWNYGDYYQWGVSPNYYGDGIPTLYDSNNKPPQTGSEDHTIRTRTDGLPSTGGYTNNKNCPFWRPSAEGGWSKYAGNYVNYRLSTDDDIAYQLNHNYRMPNNEDFTTLVNYTEPEHFTSSNYHGVNGFKFKGKDDYNDRFIFIPAAGGVGTYSATAHWAFDMYDRGARVYLWSSDRYYSNEIYAHIFSDMEGESVPTATGEYGNRWLGCPVRGIRYNN